MISNDLGIIFQGLYEVILQFGKKAFLVSRYLYCLARKKLMYILIEI